LAPVAPRPAPPALIGCPPPIRQLPSRPIPPQIRWPCNGTPEVFMTPRFFVHFVHFVALARSRAILAEVLAQFRDVCLRQSRADRGGWAVISSQSAGARPEHSTTNPDTIKEPGSPRRVRLGGFRNPRLSRREPRPHALRPLSRATAFCPSIVPSDLGTGYRPIRRVLGLDDEHLVFDEHDAPRRSTRSAITRVFAGPKPSRSLERPGSPLERQRGCRRTRRRLRPTC